ncbi:MAG TPA: insulinase family protein, partial [Tepidisphaeraceae bacterium]|nr:insulinase family protein [Tepidisphaeraceae bacterium]
MRKNVAEAKHGREFTHEIPPEPPVLAQRTLAATFPKLGQARLDLGFPSVSEHSSDLYAMDLLASILGAGESSLLVQELRDRQQLVSEISTSDNTPQYADGTFDVSMQLDTDKIPDATKAILEQIEKIKTELIEDSRIERAKTQIRAQRVKDLQTSEGVASSLAIDFFSTGDPHFSDRYVDRIAKVTAQQLQEAAQKYLVKSRLLTTALVPEESTAGQGLPKAEDLLRAVAPTTQPKNEEKNDQITRVQLDNGVILLHKRIATSPLVEVRMYSLGGLTAEDEKTNGLGNLAMQTLSRGTKTRNAEQIAEFFDSIGGDFETACGNNSWSWNMTCMKGDLPKAIEVYADIVANPAFADSELAEMKQRISAGIDSEDADWHSQAMRFFRQAYFGPNKSPYQFIPIGQKQVVSDATGDQLRQWYSGKVLKGRRVVAIFGDVSLDDAQALAKKYLGGGEKIDASVEAPPQDHLNPATGEAAVEVSRVEVLKTEQPLAGIVIGYKSDSVIGQSSSFALDVLQTMASGWGYPTGYLFDTLRGRGLVYVVQANDMPGVRVDLPGTFIVLAGCDPKNVNTVVDLILENVARCQGTDQDMQSDWFERSKQL